MRFAAADLWRQIREKFVPDVTHPGRSTMRMLQKLRPGAGHRRLWPALLVAGLLGGIGLALFFLL
jgi:hypothetical protein